MKSTVLFVDDDKDILEVLTDRFSEEYITIGSTSGPDAINIAKSKSDISAIVMDIRMAGMDGIEATREIRKILAKTPIIFYTAFPGEYDEREIDINEKPFDYIIKGGSLPRLRRSIKNAVKAYNLEVKSSTSSENRNARFGLVGSSAAMTRLFRDIEKVSSSESNVLILGETGTGKSLVAKAIHDNSNRKGYVFKKFDCNHTPVDLVEAHLFGHMKGAFTGADTERKGLFEYADGGTVFLDEIGDLSKASQGKILEVIEEGTYEPLGWTGEKRKTNTRIICATNRDLDKMVESGSFRYDLYCRIKAISVTIPPLRQRKEDIPLLVDYVAKRLVQQNKVPERVFDESAIEGMIAFDWPGNVRQLLMKVEEMMIMSDSAILFSDDVHRFIENSSNSKHQDLKSATDAFERTHIILTLVKSSGDITRAAEVLAIDRATLHRKIKYHNINMEGFR